MSFGKLNLSTTFLWLCAFFEILIGVVEAENSTREEGSLNGYAAWPLPILLILFFVNIMLAAIFSGLTIGLFGMDFIMLDIISSAGKEPDSTYAKKIIPIRKYGHQLLATLLIGNMLTMVIISQMVAAMIQSTELVNFIVATIVVFFFAEIIPMGICNKGPYALWIGARSAPIVSIALFLLYPVAKPLGMLLGCIVKHDEGLVYDKNELKKLISIHCEKYADKSGLGHDEMRMIIGALEINESCLSEILTPLDKVQMLSSDTPITRKLIEKLWLCGKSRLPVYTNNCRSHIIGILYVRDLINIELDQFKKNHIVADIVNKNPRDIVIVPKIMSLQELLKVFLSTTSQLLFVGNTNSIQSSEDRGEITSGAGSEVILSRTTELTIGEPYITSPKTIILTPQSALEGHTIHEIVGIVTLEDVIERIIKADIYDEYDNYMIEEVDVDDYEEEEEEEKKKELGEVVIEGKVENGRTEIVNTPPRRYEPVPRVMPRVNFYSYALEDENAISKTNNNNNNNAMTEDQKWALSNYLVNSYVAFATWSLPQMKHLIDRVGDHVVRLPNTKKKNNNNNSKEEKEEEEEGPFLYRRGEPSNTFTLLLSGGVRLTLGSDSFSTEKRSFSAFGEAALMNSDGFTPDYTAVFSRPSRFIQFTTQDVVAEARRSRRGRSSQLTETNNNNNNNSNNIISGEEVIAKVNFQSVELARRGDMRMEVEDERLLR